MPAPSAALPALRLAAVGFGLSALAGIFRGIQFHRLWRSNIPEELGDLQSMMQLTAGVDLLAALLIGFGLFAAARALGAQAQLMATSGLVICGFSTLWSLQSLLPEAEALQSFARAVPWFLYLIAQVGLYAGALLLLKRHARTPDRGAVLVGGSTALFALGGWAWLLARHLDLIPEGLKGGGGGFLVSAILANTGELLLAGTLLLLATRIGVATPDASPWRAAADGLRLFRAGLMVRVLTLVVVVAVSVLAAVSRSVEGMKIVLYGGTGLALLTGGVMAAGLGRYALAIRAGAATGLLATVMIAIGLVIDAWLLTQLPALFDGRLGMGRSTQGLLLWAQAASQGLGLIGILALLGSLGAAANSTGRPDLTGAARSLGAAVIVLFVGAIGMRALAEGRAISGGVALVVGGAVLAFAVFVLTRLFGIVGALADALDAPPSREA